MFRRSASYLFADTPTDCRFVPDSDFNLVHTAHRIYIYKQLKAAILSETYCYDVFYVATRPAAHSALTTTAFTICSEDGPSLHEAQWVASRHSHASGKMHVGACCFFVSARRVRERTVTFVTGQGARAQQLAQLPALRCYNTHKTAHIVHVPDLRTCCCHSIVHITHTKGTEWSGMYQILVVNFQSATT